jgi:hypothetical protein
MAITAGKKAARSLARETYELGKMSSPQVFLLSMVIFLAIIAFISAILFRQVAEAFSANPGLNGLIIGVLVIGIVLAILQVGRLFREVNWVNALRAGEPDAGADPVLLAPMKALVGRRSSFALSTNTMRSILDSIATRLDESRDISRYLTGLLVFLGLLGTFWGLLETISSIGDTIQTLDPKADDANSMLDSLKSGLSAPLAGMSTAFSSSLLGLSGSLILGFLDLQAGRAQNRFYTELENWLSSVTDTDHDHLAIQAASAGANPDELKVLTDRLKAATDSAGGSSQKTVAAMASLAEGIQGLVKNMRTEQQMMRDWVESQAAEQRATRAALERIAKSLSDKKG